VGGKKKMPYYVYSMSSFGTGSPSFQFQAGHILPSPVVTGTDFGPVQQNMIFNKYAGGSTNRQEFAANAAAFGGNNHDSALVVRSVTDGGKRTRRPRKRTYRTKKEKKRRTRRRVSKWR